MGHGGSTSTLRKFWRGGPAAHSTKIACACRKLAQRYLKQTSGGCAWTTLDTDSPLLAHLKAPPITLERNWFRDVGSALARLRDAFSFALRGTAEPAQQGTGTQLDWVQAGAAIAVKPGEASPCTGGGRAKGQRLAALGSAVGTALGQRPSEEVMELCP